MDLGITATQVGMFDPQLITVERLIEQFLNGGNGRMGDCVGGDAQFATLIHKHGGTVISHPPIKEYKRAFYPADLVMPAKEFIPRNHDICNAVSRAGGLMIGGPKDFQMPSNLRGQGTWSTINYCFRQAIPIVIVFPDGACEKHGAIRN